MAKALIVCLFAGALVLVTPVGLAALRSGLGQTPLPDPLAVLDARLPVVFRIHMVACGLGLLLLPWTLLARRHPALHRWLGRGTAVLLVIGGVAALPSALASAASPVARLGFLMQGLLFLFYMARAVDAAVHGRMRQHARLVVRAAAIAFGAVVLRVMLMVVAWGRLPFAPSYAVIAWLAWVLPLLLIVRWPSRKPASFFGRADGYPTAGCALPEAGSLTGKATRAGMGDRISTQ